MVGSDVRLDPPIVEGIQRMTHAEMEDAIKNCDRRLTRIEEILPTLATKSDLSSLRHELREEIADSRRHAGVLTESIRDDIRLLAEAVASLTLRFDAMDARFGVMERRFGAMELRGDAMDARFGSLTRRLERKGMI